MSAELVKRLEGYRRQHDLTYNQLAQRLGVPETYLYRWKNKKRIIGIYKKIVEEFLK